MAILLITHDMGIAAEMADRIVVMYAGEIVEKATALQLFEKPHHPYTKGLLQSITTMDSDRKAKLFSIPGSIPNLFDLPTGCHFHPRCPYASQKCLDERPPLQEINGREAACWHTEQIAHLNVKKLPKVSRETEASTIDNVKPQSLLGKEEVLFEIKEISKFYPVKKSVFNRHPQFIRAVDNVSFDIRKGETFGLVGESGSGKSTLGRAVVQLEKATAGQVLYQGRDLTLLNEAGLREERKHMQMIFQDPYGSMNPRWKIGDIIGEPLSVHENLSAKEKRIQVGELLEVVGLNASWYDRYPHEFSGGQRQRIGIARAIALKPSFILADEAVSALDVSVQAQIINLMQDLQQRLGLTYLFIAHGLHIVRHISDRIGVMYLGKLVEIADSDQLFSHPAHHYTQALIASIPWPDPTRKKEFVAIQGEIPSPANPPSGCRFHTRCPAATALCKEIEPELKPLHEGHSVACHYPI